MKSPHFTAGKNEAQRRKGIHPRSHGEIGGKQGHLSSDPPPRHPTCVSTSSTAETSCRDSALLGIKVPRALGRQEPVTSYHSPPRGSFSIPSPTPESAPDLESETWASYPVSW